MPQNSTVRRRQKRRRNRQLAEWRDKQEQQQVPLTESSRPVKSPAKSPPAKKG